MPLQNNAACHVWLRDAAVKVKLLKGNGAQPPLNMATYPARACVTVPKQLGLLFKREARVSTSPDNDIKVKGTQRSSGHRFGRVARSGASDREMISEPFIDTSVMNEIHTEMDV